MLVVIDESGDVGFKIVKGSSSHFVLAMVIFHKFEDAERTSETIARARDRLRIKGEFKFSKSSTAVRDGFFETVADCQFSVRALVVDKSVIYSDHLRDRTDQFYNYFVQQLLRNDGGTLVNAKVKIDGCGNKVFKRELSAYLRREVSRDKVSKVSLHDARDDNLLQLADMCSGAILKAYRSAPSNDHKWLLMLRRKGRIDDIWPFR